MGFVSELPSRLADDQQGMKGGEKCSFVRIERVEDHSKRETLTLSRMSSNRPSGFSEGTRRVSFDLLAQPCFAHRFDHDIDRPADKSSQLITQRVQPAKIRETARGRVLGKPHSDIHIGIRAIFTARHRTEDRQADDPGSLEFLLMSPKHRYDGIAEHKSVSHISPAISSNGRSVRHGPFLTQPLPQPPARGSFRSRQTTTPEATP